MESSGQLETLVDSDCVRVGCWRSLFIQVWYDQPLRYHQELVSEAFEAMIERYGEQGFVTLSVLSMSQLTTSPEAGVRERSKAQFARVNPYVKVSALVFEVSGLTGRTVRTFVKALLLVTRPRAETRTFDSMDDGLAWLCHHEHTEAGLREEAEALSAALSPWRHPPA